MAVRGRIAAALIALVAGLGVVSFFAPVPGIVRIAAGALALVVVVGWLIPRLGGWSEPESEEEFDRVVERAERLGAAGVSGEADDDFDEPDEDDWESDDLFDPSREEDFQALVRAAIDDLPVEFHRALEHVAVVVSDGGRRRRAYGMYEGDGIAQDHFHDRILIFRDTLVRDFGRDPERLKQEVTRTVRHELAHHLGWGEPGVRGLGL